MRTDTYIIEQMIDNLKATDPLVRIHAATILGSMGNDAHAAVPTLIGLLIDGDIHDRKVAALTLGEIGPGAREAISALFAAAAAEDALLAELAMTALEQIDRVEEHVSRA